MEMIEIRYSTKRGIVSDMADISGSWRDFETLRRLLLKFLNGNAEKIFVDADKTADSEGWDFILEGLEMNQNGDFVKVSVMENKILNIKGSKENLDIFISWLEFDENTISGYHSHYEYFEGNEYIDSKSIPLIIRVK
jgi:hypothetical protein